MNIFRREESKPRRFARPRTPQCIHCSMPGPYTCEIASCGAPLCLKHRKRKAGGTLCEKHYGSQLIQQDAVPQSRFKDPGEAVPHED
jgi:hypothetical protein